MAILWRISNFTDLSGMGGLRAGGRWHTQGSMIVYLAEHPSLALLEVMAGMELDYEDLPDNFKLLKVEVPDEEMKACFEPSLTQEWTTNERATQAIGDEWLRLNETLLAKVPSAILPESTNYLFNSNHKNAQNAKIIEVISFPFDKRLVT